MQTWFLLAGAAKTSKHKEWAASEKHTSIVNLKLGEIGKFARNNKTGWTMVGQKIEDRAKRLIQKKPSFPKHMVDRNDKRLKAYKFGQLHFSDGTVVKCIINNFNTQGVQATLETPATLPTDFTVTVLAACIERRRAHKVWQSGAEVGIEFKR